MSICGLRTFCKKIPEHSSCTALQAEELDDRNVQQTPPGFHLVHLPFADDIRKIKYAEDTPRGEKKCSSVQSCRSSLCGVHVRLNTRGKYEIFCVLQPTTNKLTKPRPSSKPSTSNTARRTSTIRLCKNTSRT